MYDILKIISTLAAVASVAFHILDAVIIRKTIEQLLRSMSEVQIKNQKVIMHSSYKITITVMTRLDILINARLFAAAFRSLQQSMDKKHKRDSTLSATITGMMVNSKASANARAYLILIFSLISYILIQLLKSQTIELAPLAVLSLLILLTHINQFIFEFRIRKGLYGFNAYEAREIISFILSHSDKSDFSNSDGLKSILPEAEMDATYKRLYQILPEFAK
jgi:hypothetical protein